MSGSVCVYSPAHCALLTASHPSQAFAPASGRRAEQQARRNVEKDQTRLHVPLVDRTFGGTSAQGGKGVTDTIPPVIIAVVGPKGVSPRCLTIVLLNRLRLLGDRRSASRLWCAHSCEGTPVPPSPTSRDQ